MTDTTRNNDNDREIRKIVIIDAPVEMVFRAIIDEKELIDWFPDLAVLEPKVGGKVRFTFHKGNSQKQDRDSSPEG